ncbi:MAG: hypothetical protein U1F57_03950 [bacterium]
MAAFFKKIVFIGALLWLGVLCLPASSRADCPPSVSGKLEELSKEFQALRRRKPPNPWGEFYQHKADVMDSLRQCLDAEKANEKRIIQLMGKPDRVARRGSPLYEWAYDSIHYTETPVGIEKAKEALIYEWRGMHDFLFFITDGEKGIISAWWAALDR